MKTLILMTMSANGFIARTNDETPWSKEEFERCAAFTREAGNLIVGRKTYEIMREEGDFDDGILTVVVTRDIAEPHGNVVYMASPEHALKYVEEKGFARAIVGGGTTLVTQFLSEGLIDEIILDIEPMLLDRGLPLAEQSIPDVALEHLSTEQFGDTVRLHYQVKK